MSEINLLSQEVCQKITLSGTWNALCPIPLERLRQVVFSHIDFEGKQHNDGELIVMDVVAPFVINIMHELHAMGFPIHQARRMDYFQGDDILSMEANNSSAFNYRVIQGTSTVSLHGYGLAIDLNPLQNPFVSNPITQSTKRCSLVEIFPIQGKDYLNRHNQRAGMVERIVAVFAKHGFRIWGGTWNNPMDYHHFQTPRWLAELLSKSSYDEGMALFNVYAKNPHISTQEDLLQVYPLA